MLTSTGIGTGIQFTPNHAFKIDTGALPPRRALEDSSADAPVPAGGGADRDAWGQVVRGESGHCRPCRRGSRNTGSGVSRACVPDRRGNPLMPLHPARATTLRKKGRAAVIRPHSFTSGLPGRIRDATQPREIKNVPGSKRTGVDRFGNPVGCLKAEKFAIGHRTEDVVRAAVPSGRSGSAHFGHLAICAGSFNNLTTNGTDQGISHRQCRIAHRPAMRGPWMQPQHVPAAKMEPRHGAQGPALLPHPRAAVSCRVSR